MTELEQTVIELAQQELATVQVFYRNKANGIPPEGFDAAWQAYLSHFHGMNALIAIAHQAHSGLSEEGRKALLTVEADHLTAYRALAN